MEQKPSHKPVPPPAVMQAEPWQDDLSARLALEFPEASFHAYLGQQFLEIPASRLIDLIEHLKRREQFDFLVDLTAIDYPKRERRFELLYILYSFAANRRIWVKTPAAENETVSTLTGIHPGANWLEREVFDMFGITFAGHPDMRRILLPDEWKGYPLRRDAGILDADTDWVKANLGIDQN